MPSPRSAPVLVTGATGKVGRRLVDRLLADGVPVRAFVRDPTTAALPAGVELVRGDLTDPASLEAPLRGVEQVFLLWPIVSSAAAADAVGAIARQAEHVVYLSALGVHDDHERQDDPILQFHAELEALVRASGLRWTVLRAGSFASNALQYAAQIRAGDVVRAPYGAMRRAVVHEADLAAAAARVLGEDEHAGETIVLTGPAPVTEIEQVEAIGAAIGRELRFEEAPRDEARGGLLEAGMPVEAADGILDAWERMTIEEPPVSPGVAWLTGRPPRSFRTWATDHVADFA